MIALAMTTDGRRGCIEQTIPSLLQRVEGIDGPRLIFDDSGDADYQGWLEETFGPEGFVVLCRPVRLGQALKLKEVWEFLSVAVQEPYIFWCEDDFLFEREIDLRDMAAVLDAHSYLQQMALLRQPWFFGEVKAGGIVERDPDEYARVVDGEHEWLEHRLWWTLNPCLFRRELCKVPRPVVKRHEWNLSRKLCEDPVARFGIWGNGKGSEPWVRHIGEQRVGTGY